MSKTPQTTELTLEYDLFDLPTAQHKAGLGGLLIMIGSMHERKLSPAPEIDLLQPTSVSVRLTRESLGAVFDDLYDADVVEIESRSKWKGKTPKRPIQKDVTHRDGKQTREKRFIYDAVQPKGQFLATLYPDGDGVWLKLWRDMLWSVLRGIPKTRGVYEERAAGRRSSLTDKTWDRLCKARDDLAKGRFLLEGVSSSLFVGAQDVNPERVGFKGRVEHNLLLHFWPIVSMVFAPRTVSVDGGLTDAGYVLAIPEAADIEAFTTEVKDLLRSLEIEAAGFRPRSALIYVPQEGGLEYLYQLSRCRITQKDLSFSLAAVELYHLQKRGNSIRALSAKRVLPDGGVLSMYEALRTTCRNPLYRSQQIRNLLSGDRWHEGCDDLFATYPWEFFIQRRGETPSRLPFFGNDVGKKFRGIEDDLTLLKGANAMNESVRDDELARRVYRIIGQYVNARTRDKTDLTWDDYVNGTGNRQAYREAREKVCSDAFLAIRGRRENDFVEYFVGSICSVPQYLPEQDYLTVTEALTANPGTVKTLCMLALSAHSYLWEPKKDKGESS
jgi:CRISPR-associated protein Cmx8